VTEQPLHVLLVEDASSGAERFRRLVAPGECLIEAVADVGHAVQAVQRSHYDAVVVDGPEAVMRLRDLAQDAALLVLRSGAAPVPLDPVDVGSQSTLDLDGLDPRSLSLSLHLAVQRHRVSQLTAAASAAAAPAGALRDPLTGLVTGERLLEDIDRMIADAVRFRRPLTVAAVQVDDVDGLLADGGRPALDCVQVHLAGVIGSMVRATDLVGRLDDGQFLIAMTATTPEAALLPVQRMQAAVDATPVAAAAVTRAVSVSVGLAGLRGLMAVDELVWAAVRVVGEAAADGPSGLRTAGWGQASAMTREPAG
jgi:diguanylate cyclase (GGDEF)-like protein